MLFLSLFTVHISIHRKRLVPMSSQSPWMAHTAIHNQFGTLISIQRPCLVQMSIQNPCMAQMSFRFMQSLVMAGTSVQTCFEHKHQSDLHVGHKCQSKAYSWHKCLGLGKKIYQIFIYQQVLQNTDRSPKSTPRTHVILVTIEDTSIHQ